MKKAFIGLVLMSCVVGATQTQAGVTIVQSGKEPVVVNDIERESPFQFFNFAQKRGPGDLVRSLARFIENNQGVFGFLRFSSNSLHQTAEYLDHFGNALRFRQVHGNVKVEGAEVVAVMNAAGIGFRSVHSSLRPIVLGSTTPSLERAQALQLAIARAGYTNPELGEDDNDGLLIATPYPGEFALVWQFSLREGDDGANPAQIQGVASGPRTGQIVKFKPLERSARGDLNIYDGSIVFVVPNPIFKGVKVLKNGKKVWYSPYGVSEAAAAANLNFSRTLEYYSQTFGRNSFDGQGAEINATVNTQRIGFLDILGQKENAAWLGPWKMFTFGAGGARLGALAQALDVVGHEFTHAVVTHTSNLTYEKQSGALNEHMADVFGAMIKQKYENPSNPFLIGAGTLRGDFAKRAEALRDMMDPHKGLSKQPAHMNEIPAQLGENCQPAAENDLCGVHINSGIPNKASALIISKLGWRQTEALFYRVMTARLVSTSNFKDYRNLMLEECQATMPAASCEVVKQAFATVGL